MSEKGDMADSAARQAEDRATRAPDKPAGGPRVCLPARATGEGWPYPEGDDSAIVRGED